MKTHYLIISFLFVSSVCFSQTDSNIVYPQKQWYISTALGIQMSGIKPEDFISHNMVPSFQFGVGVWFTPEIALQLSYKGFYFNTIADEVKHSYDFFFGEVLLNINELILGKEAKKNRWSVVFHPGAGLFNNKYYNQINICGNIGIMNSYKINESLELFLDISTIVGWDIYQGDDDIIPSFGIGINYYIE